MKYPALHASLTTFAAVLGVLTFAVTVSASHSWGGYHWARTSNPFTVKLGDNLTSPWDSYLATTSSDWSVSDVLDTTVVSGQSKGNCRATSGRVEICNKAYGNNGWLGVAQIWVNGLHITQGTVKMNDTYFNTAKYNTPAWKNLVLCQEVGHTFGLDHQDEDFNNLPLGTCMDYTSDPTPNQHPNAHDYEELDIIYAHLDATTTLSASLPQGANDNAADVADPPAWGKVIKKDTHGHSSLYERDLGNGHKVFTFVVWADPE